MPDGSYRIESSSTFQLQIFLTSGASLGLIAGNHPMENSWNMGIPKILIGIASEGTDTDPVLLT